MKTLKYSEKKTTVEQQDAMMVTVSGLSYADLRSMVRSIGGIIRGDVWVLRNKVAKTIATGLYVIAN